jgi:predicted metalloprotease with PDZ domain
LCARVLWISPGGPAHRAGIKVGDRVSPVSQFHPDFNCNLSFSTLSARFQLY